MQPSAGATGPPREFVPDRAESDVDDPDLGAAAMEADAEGGGGGAGSGLRPSATFADWPEDDAEGEVVPRHQPRVGPSGTGSSAGLAGQGGLKAPDWAEFIRRQAEEAQGGGRRDQAGGGGREGQSLPQGSEEAAASLCVSVSSFVLIFLR